MPHKEKSIPEQAKRTGLAIAVDSTRFTTAFLGLAAIALATLFIYLPSLRGGFLWDDDRLVTANRLVETSDGLYRIWFTSEAVDYWPVTNTTFWIEWRLWGMNPAGYHVTNLLLHIVEVLLIWLILRKLSIPGAFLAAMLFAMHPINVESVAWIAQRKNMMAMLFFLLSVLWYLKGTNICKGAIRTRSVGMPSRTENTNMPTLRVGMAPRPLAWYLLSLAAFILAMLSKGSVAVLPVILLGLIWWQRRITSRDLRLIAPYFIIAAALTGINIWFQTHGSGDTYRTAGFVERLLGAGGVVWFYLYKAVLPLDLAYVYAQWNIQVKDLLWWLPLIAALAVSALLWLYRNSWSRPFLFAWGFFCVALIPVMGFVDIEYMQCSLIADHYQHIALIGVVALAATGLITWQKQVGFPFHSLAYFVIIVLVGTLATLAWHQAGLYSDPIKLYQASLAKNPESHIVHNALGFYLNDKGDRQEAIHHFQEALRLKPDFIEARNNLGMVLNKAGRTQDALEEFERIVHERPDYAEGYSNLGSVLKNTGRIPEAIGYFEKALLIKPDFYDAHNNLANALLEAGRLPEATEHYRQALASRPNNAEAHNNLGVVLQQAGQTEEAIEHFRQALRLNSKLPDIQNNLGNALCAMGRPQEAIPYYEQALSLAPGFAKVHNNLANALSQTGQLDKAIEHYREALRLQPGYIDAYFNLAITYSNANRSSDAIEAAEKALEIARTKGRTEMAQRIEEWLYSHRDQKHAEQQKER